METFGFFQIPLSAEPAQTTDAPKSRTSKKNLMSSEPQYTSSDPTSSLEHDENIAEMARNPVCWMMP